MLDKIEYYGRVKDGQLFIGKRKDFDEAIKRFEGREVEVIVQKKRFIRSVQQNRLWWLYMDILHKKLGYSKEEVHELCKFRFLKREKVIESTGEVMEYLESTTRLTRTQFAETIDKLVQWAAEMNIVMPLPNEQLKIQ
jgi:phage pi2 protein 07